MKYETHGYIKYTEEDDWEKGCLPNSAREYFIDIHFESDTIDGLIEQLMKHFGTDSRKYFELDACEELGRIDYQVTENLSGLCPSSEEMEAFKEGKCRLWAVTYSIKVEAVERKSVALRPRCIRHCL